MIDWDNQRTILILDHSKEMRDFCRLAFESAGYRVTIRDRALGSVAAILREKPDIVLLDLGMSTVSGEHIARILSKAARNKMLLILHSDIPLETLRLKAVRAGAQGYVQKTHSPTELVRRVEEWVQRAPRAPRAPRAQRLSGVTRIAPDLAQRDGPSVESMGAPPTQAAHAPDVDMERETGISNASRTRSDSRSGASNGLLGRKSSLPDVIADANPGSRRRPMRAHVTEPAASAGRSPSTTMRLGMRVLVADPDRVFLEDIRRAIGSEFRGEYTTSGDAALAILIGTPPPEAVVASLNLVGTSASKLYRCARAVDPGLAERFVFLAEPDTTEPDSEFVMQLDARVFYKPVTPDRLLFALRQLEPRRRLRRSK